MARKRAPELSASPSPSALSAGPRVGWVCGFQAGHGLLVNFEGNPQGEVAARSTVSLDEKTIQEAITRRQGAVLLFEEGDLSRPIVMGLLQEMSETPHLDLMLQSDGDHASEDPLVARVDGRRVLIEGKDEIVLRCGEASVTLRRNGKVVIRGTYLVSRASGTNRIKGGSVQIN